MNIAQIYKQFPTEADCIAHLERVRWHGVPVCPYCKATASTPIPSEQRHHCNSCNTTFSVTVNTIFHHTHLPLQKWFLAISLVLNAKKGVPARQLGRDWDVNKNTAWYMGMRIRNAIFDEGQLLQGICQMDETYIGGKPRKGSGGNLNKSAKHNLLGRGTATVPVVGIIARNGNIVARPIDKSLPNAKRPNKFIRDHADVANATLITDEYTGYVLCPHLHGAQNNH